MNSTELQDRLLQAARSSDFPSEAESISESLREDGADLDAVRIILRFMEDNPSFDFGTPGPLVHFIETFYGRGYEAEVLVSIERRPTSHTLWLLNRLINGAKLPEARASLVHALRQAEGHSQADEQARELAACFLQRLSS